MEITGVSVLFVTADGTSGVTNSTNISLVFNQAVTGLTANDIVVTDGTGSVVKGALTGSGTNWTLALTSITSEGNISLTINDFGTFHVTNNPQTVAVYKENASVIETVESNKIMIYPNPVKNKLSIKADLEIKKVEICDLTGHNVKLLNATTLQNGMQTIDVSSLRNGIYLVKVYANNGFTVSKIVKE